jgi:hypothetical protein
LIDEISIDLVPVPLGEGISFCGSLDREIQLDDAHPVSGSDEEGAGP